MERVKKRPLQIVGFVICSGLILLWAAGILIVAPRHSRGPDPETEGVRALAAGIESSTLLDGRDEIVSNWLQFSNKVNWTFVRACFEGQGQSPQQLYRFVDGKRLLATSYGAGDLVMLRVAPVRDASGALGRHAVRRENGRYLYTWVPEKDVQAVIGVKP